MSIKTPGAITRQTIASPFFSCNADRTALFTVRAGISAEDALNQASCFLSCASSIVNDAAMGANEENQEAIFSAAYLVEFSKALVDACLQVIETSPAE